MDEFDIAVENAFSSDLDVRVYAVNFLQSVKESEIGWRQCVGKLQNENCPIQSSFECLNIVEYAIVEKSLGMDDLELLIGGLRSYRDIVSSTSFNFLKNKFASIMAYVMKLTYPTVWPDYFNDLFEYVSDMNHSKIEIVFRILKQIHLEMINRDSSDDSSTRNSVTLIKDNMRRDVNHVILELVYNILNQIENPELINLVLDAYIEFIHWVDISQTTNPNLLNTIYRFTGVTANREKAAAYLLELVNKGMPYDQKLQLLESLNIGDFIRSTNLTNDEDAIDYFTLLGELLSSTCINVLEGWINLENKANIYMMLEDLIILLCAYLDHDFDEVSQSSLPFFQMYFSKLNNLKHKNIETGIDHTQFLSVVIPILEHKMTYDFDYNFEEPEDLEFLFNDFRKDLDKMFMKAAKLNPEYGFNYVKNLIGTISQMNLSDQNTFFKLEVIQHLFYLIGECIPTDIFKEAVPFITEVISTFTSYKLAEHPHPAVSSAYFFVLERYAKHLPRDPETISALLTVIIEKGIYNNSNKVSSTCSYLFISIVKHLKKELLPFLPSILNSINSLLDLSSASNSSISMSYVFDLYECIGILIGGLSDLEMRDSFAQSFISPIINITEQIVKSKEFMKDTLENPIYENRLCNYMEAIGMLSKGFKLEKIEKGFLHLEFERFFWCAHQYLGEYSGFNPSRVFDCFLFINQRYIDMLLDHFLELIPHSIDRLLSLQYDADRMIKFIIFVNQISSNYDKKVFNVMNSLYIPLVQNIKNLLSIPVTPGSEEERELVSLNYSLLSFLRNLAFNGLQDVFISEQNIGTFASIIETLLQGLQHSTSRKEQKICVKVFVALAPAWCLKNNDYDELLLNQVIPLTLQIPYHFSFNLDKVDSYDVIKVICGMYCTLAKIYGDRFFSILTPSLSQIGWTDDELNFFLKLTIENAVKKLSSFMRKTVSRIKSNL